VRLWTLHPKYLDAKGLVALWREALLAQKVLRGETKGYRRHPQLLRFSQTANPSASLAAYLVAVHAEATQRGYHFDISKIGSVRARGQVFETRGQLLYEWRHLQRKLKLRDAKKYKEVRATKIPARIHCSASGREKFAIGKKCADQIIWADALSSFL
jgi:hypothetical protein